MLRDLTHGFLMRALLLAPPTMTIARQHAQEPLGLLERQAEDAGPDTKSRRRPAPVDPNPPKAWLHHAETQDALKDEVARRKGC